MEATAVLSRPADEPHAVASEPVLQGHIPALDGIRGLAILLVTIYRFNGGSEGAEATDSFAFRLASMGFRGVDLFFVLSGFLIAGILLDSKQQPHYFRNFYARRALRILPLYYGMLVAALVLLLLVSEGASSIFAKARDRQAWLWLLGTNILQAKIGGWPFGCFDHFWSLAVEGHFYLVWPLVIFLTNHRTAIAACIAVILLSITTRVAWLLAGGNDVAPEVFALFRADALAMGALLAMLAKQPGGLMRWRLWTQYGGWMLGISLVLLTIGNRRLLTIPDTLFAAFFACLISAAVVAPVGTTTSAFWNAGWLRFFGKYSYAMYVFQYPLIPILAPILSVELLTNLFGNNWAARVTYILLMTAITTAVAFASWHLYERHFLSLKHLFPSRPGRSA
jgi:peptidoglycan/LPS O-acetylase OafA/YrhL